MRFSIKLTVLFSVILFAAVSVISGLVYTSNITTLEEHITDRLKNQAFHTMHKIDMMLFERYEDIKIMSTDPVISSRSSTLEQLTKRLTEFRNGRGYDSLAFYDLNKTCIADTSGTNIGKKHLPPEIWQGLEEGRDIFMAVVKSDFLNKVILRFSSVVKDKKGTPVGFVVSRVPIESLYDIVKQAVGIYDVEKDFFIELLDKNGLILYSNYDTEVILKGITHEWDAVKALRSKGLAYGALKSTDPKEKTGEEIHIFANQRGYKGFKGNDWTLMIKAPTKIAFASAIELQKKIIALAGAVWLLGIFIIYIFSRRVSKPIDAIGAAADEIADGNLEVFVENSSTDEIGRLANSFNRMAEALKGQREELLGNSKVIEAAYSEMKKLINAIEQAAEGIVLAGMDGAIQYVNPAFTAMTGYRPEEVLGKNPSILNSGKNPPELFRDMWKTILSGRKWTGVLINKKKTGELYHEEIAVSPVTDKEGEITSFIAINNDITERIKADENLRKNNIELENARLAAEAANRAKSEFLANMSHELRTPLNHIIGFSEMMREGMTGPLTDKQKEYAGDIADSGNRLLSVLNEILDLSRIDAGETGLELSEFDIRLMLERSLELFKEKALKHNIKTSLEIEDGLSIITADQKKIRQVVGSLLGNALKFSPDGGSVSVRARKIEDEVKIEDEKMRSYEVATKIEDAKKIEDEKMRSYEVATKIEDAKRVEDEEMGGYEVAEKNVTSQLLNFSTSQLLNFSTSQPKFRRNFGCRHRQWHFRRGPEKALQIL